MPGSGIWGVFLEAEIISTSWWRNIILPAHMSFSSPAPRTNPEKLLKKESGFTFSLLTYNVNFGSFVHFDPHEPTVCSNAKLGMSHRTFHHSLSSVMQAIAQADADLVCLQETNEGWEWCSQQFLGKQYPHQYFFHSKTGYYAAGIAFLHKDNFKPASVSCKPTGVDGSFFDGQLIHGSFLHDPHSTPINIVNVHLRPPLAMGNDDDGILGNINAYLFTAGKVHQGEIHNLLQISQKQHSDRSQEPFHAFVTGDFNEGSMGDGYQYLVNVGYSNALDLSDDKTTWYWPVIWGQNIWGSYDHIFASPKKFKALNCNVGKTYMHASDHLPVHANFKVLTGELLQSVDKCLNK